MIYNQAKSILTKYPGRHLGINACAVCAQPEVENGVECKLCQNIYNCSQTCLNKDTTSHNKLICKLLKQCAADDSYENSQTSISQSRASSTHEDQLEDSSQTETETKLRLQSEQDSYPKTLHHQHLQHLSALSTGSSHCHPERLVYHVIGASPAELQALPTYLSLFSQQSPQISLSFIGPQLNSDSNYSVPANSNSNMSEDSDPSLHSSSLARSNPQIICIPYKYEVYASSSSDSPIQPAQEILDETKAGNNSKNILYEKPDYCVFFNPGFTCLDYEWEKALSCIPANTAFFATTNTEAGPSTALSIHPHLHTYSNNLDSDMRCYSICLPL